MCNRQSRTGGTCHPYGVSEAIRRWWPSGSARRQDTPGCGPREGEALTWGEKCEGGRGHQEMESAPCPNDLSIGDLPTLREAFSESWLVDVRREALDAYSCFGHFLYAETRATQMWSAPVAASQVELFMHFVLV